MMRPPHFTYTAMKTHRPMDADAAMSSAYNEILVADRVVRACAWTDNSADFVFGDGTVLSFCDEMQTFVAIHGATTAASTSQGSVNSNSSNNNDDGDYFFTSLTLSKYEKKVKNALHIYNYYSPRPRIIAGLMATPCEVWRLHSPIDSLVIAADRRLFERNGSEATLWCALRRISLTLHGNRVTFSVRWPARAVERNGARSIFVRPFDEHGCMTGTFESLQAFHYMWVEQTFPVLCPPEGWVKMLQVALQLDAENPVKGAIGTENGTCSAPELDEENCRMMYSTTPQTAQDRQPCRFSKIKREHIHALISTPQMQNATCNRLIRNPCERVTWRYDADPLGRVPHAVYWGLHTCNVDATAHLPFTGSSSSISCDNSGGIAMWDLHIPRYTTGSVLAMVREDESTVLAEPQGHGYVVHHWRRDGTYKQYHQSADGALGLPPVIPLHQNRSTRGGDGSKNNGCGGGDGATSAAEGSLLSSSMLLGEQTAEKFSSRFTTSPMSFGENLEDAPFSALHRGRYLPEVGASCIQVSQLNLASLRTQQQETLGGAATVVPGIQAIGILGLNGADIPSGHAGEASSSPTAAMVGVSSSSASVVDRNQMRLISSDPALAIAAAEGNVVYLTSSIDGVGNFSALTNGTIRCHFNDRTILFLIPGADDREESLVATCIYRDATQCSMRLVKCFPHHPMYRYVAYALHFRRFARLSPEARNTVLKDTIELKMGLLEDIEWRRENKAEHELQELLSRTRALLSGNDELSRENCSFLSGNRSDRSSYFS